MANNPFFSVVIATKNAAQTLANCLKSLSEQTFKDFEVLVIDAASADNTVPIAESYKTLLNLNCNSEPDKGTYDAMNKAIAIAKGNYFYFLGTDDSLYSNTILEQIANELIKSKSMVLYGNVMMRGTNQWVEADGIHAGEFDLRRLLSHNICHQSMFYHKEVFKTIGNYNIKYPVYADHDFNLRCFAKYDFHFFDIIIANFNVGGLSTMVQDRLFDNEKDTNIIHYFFNKLHTKSFIGSRLYIKNAAFSSKVHINAAMRLYCLLVYLKLKTQSLFN